MIRPDADRSDAGFTLIEVLVAFVVLALVVTATLNAYAGSTRTEARARQASDAAALLRERLSAIDTLDLQDGAGLAGEANGMRWTIRASRHAAIEESTPEGAQLSWITISVMDVAGVTHSATTARWAGEAPARADAP